MHEWEKPRERESVCVCVWVSVCVCVCVCVCVYVCVCIHMHMYACTCCCASVCALWMYVFVRICVCIHQCLSVSNFKCACIYAHNHRELPVLWYSCLSHTVTSKQKPQINLILPGIMWSVPNAHIIILLFIIIFEIIVIIVFKGAIWDFVQSPHCAANRLQHVRSSGLGVILCKSHATHWANIMCNSCYMPHGMKGQFSYYV